MRSVLINFCFQSPHQHLSLNSIAASSTLFFFVVFLFFFHSTRSRRIFQVQRRCPTFQSFFFIFIFFSARQWKSYAHISSLLYSSQKKTRKEKEGKWSGVFWEILKMVRIAITKISTATGKIFFARSWDVIACEWDFVT